MPTNRKNVQKGETELFTKAIFANFFSWDLKVGELTVKI